MHAGIAVAETRVPSPPLFCYLLVPHLLCPLPLSPPHLGILPFAPVHIRVFPSVSLSLLLLSLSLSPPSLLPFISAVPSVLSAPPAAACSAWREHTALHIYMTGYRNSHRVAFLCKCAPSPPFMAHFCTVWNGAHLSPCASFPCVIFDVQFQGRQRRDLERISKLMEHLHVGLLLFYCVPYCGIWSLCCRLMGTPVLQGLWESHRGLRNSAANFVRKEHRERERESVCV